jgi:L-lactate dehydrogenase complex protein LldE
MAMVRILRHLGYEPIYDSRQTCCGQPAFNAGHRNEARKVAENFIEIFKDVGTIVSPSGSCIAMVRNYYPVLFRDHPAEKLALQLRNRAMEFSEFLAQENLIARLQGSFTGRVGFHNSCHSYRELGIKGTPGQILRRITGYELVEIPGEPVCCGFGGLFSFKFDHLAARMGHNRISSFLDQNANVIVSNDPGCIMHMRQEAKSENQPVRVLHLTEFLAEAMRL